MNRQVLKFGGSNLQTAADIPKLVRAISCYPRPPLVVVSALAGVTDSLDQALDRASQNVDSIYTLVKFLLKRHQQFIDSHIDPGAGRRSLLQALSRRILELERCLLGIHYLHEIPDFARDQILSFGERLSSLLLSGILPGYGMACRERLPEELGLLTDGQFGNASVDMAASRPRVAAALQNEELTIVPGFYGLSPSGKITLLGRGGSDYSAAAYAACIDAASLDIWKDVSGFMSADPKLVTAALSIDRLSYLEAAELSYFGAKILHPRTFEPVMDHGIPIRLYDINRFSPSLSPLTEIRPGAVVCPGIVKSVTSTTAIGLLKLHGSAVGIRAGLLATVCGALHQARINIKSVFTSQTSINLLLDSDQLERGHSLIQALKLPSLDEISVSADAALVAVVGEGMAEQPGIAARIFSAVSRENINIRIISSGASAVASYFIVADRDRCRAVNAIHEEFFS